VQVKDDMKSKLTHTISPEQAKEYLAFALLKKGIVAKGTHADVQIDPATGSYIVTVEVEMHTKHSRQRRASKLIIREQPGEATKDSATEESAADEIVPAVIVAPAPSNGTHSTLNPEL